MTKNQLLALRPGDKVWVKRFTGHRYYTVRMIDSVWDIDCKGMGEKRIYGVRLDGLYSLYEADEIEHYREDNEQV